MAPGSSESGFGFQADGLPGIVRCDLVGERRVDYDGGPGDYSTDEINRDFDAVYEALRAQFPDKKSNAVVKQCLGPVPPPIPFDPAKYVEYILDLKNQSLTLGWIKDAAVSDELGGKLSAISGQLAALTDNKISLTTGRQVLELAAQFMQFVEGNSCKDFDCPVPEGQSPKPLTSEAYALLYFNMDYFATQVAKACNVPPPVIEPSPKRQPAKAGKSAKADKPSTADRPAPTPSKK
ncbi:MAG: hypothetical protein HYY13_12215 [Nitrospirae bacterium]|nr:hypothetical protein [Nitrospirota bacterium]